MRFIVLLLLCAATAAAADWTAYGGSAAGTRYSDAKTIHTANVGRLKQAWSYRTGHLDGAGALTSKVAFEATPLFVDDMLIFSTPLNQVFALRGDTGTQLWSHDPGIDRNRRYSEVTSRGVSYWSDGKGKGECASRVITGTIDARLIALDARTGKPCAQFGRGGEVPLQDGIRIRNAGDYQVTSPPAIVGDVIVVGSSIGDNRAADLERGTVRGFDARTGKLVWSWDPLADLAGTGGGNAWGVMSADPQRKLVFVPTGSPSPDFYGGKRQGSNKYANSVTALHAKTGKVAWSFQAVHHDLWDYDIASQPALVDTRVDGKTVAAVVVTTKMGLVFLLDRETGKPLSPVEERKVPASDVPGEDAWPTQPWPAAIEPLVPTTFDVEKVWGATEEDREWCREQVKDLRSEGIYTPPSLRGSIFYPGNVGGVAWGGPAYDPVRGWVIVNVNRLATVVRLIPREKATARAGNTGENRLRYEFAQQSGTPYAMERAPLMTMSRSFCNPPPWGTLVALDLGSGRKRWEVPLGSMNGQPGSFSLGGPLVTAGGLTFIAATVEEKLRAFETATGKLLWEAALPASAQATPMTYEYKGRQYVVICAGGHAKVGTKLGDYVVAFAVPDPLRD